MSEFSKKIPATPDLGAILIRGLRESAFMVYLALALFMFVALVTFDVADAGWSHGGGLGRVGNAAGAVGAWLADFSLTIFGITAFLFPFLLGGYGYSVFKGRSLAAPTRLQVAVRWGGFAVAMAAAASLADFHLPRPPLALPETSGGILGQELANLLAAGFGGTGASILLIALFLGGVSIYTGLSWVTVIDVLGRGSLGLMDGIGGMLNGRGAEDADESGPAAKRRAPASEDRQDFTSFTPESRPQPARPSVPVPAFESFDDDEDEDDDGNEIQGRAATPPQPAALIRPRKPFPAPAPAPTKFPPVESGALPSLDLLTASAPKIRGYSRETLEEMSRQVETILDDFGVEVRVTEVHPGPVITRFEIEPAPGVKVSRISGLAKDLARALSVTSVRVVEIIPGKSVIGLEIPNEERELVLLRAVLASDAYQHANSALTLVLGKDISGQPVVANLARMPHLLVAGTTGSGKSVAVNVMILSMLYKARPDEVRLIMIDPKMLELSVYEGIPHLLTPVVTDMKEAANALRWCVAEMERRYKLMSLMGVRNLAGFNQKITDAAAAGEPIFDPMWSADQALEGEEPPLLEPLPCIVIVIDELADMMMIVGKKVEELIARLAQKARAAGLHLILATQRPSVDVITGLIKANIPTRLAFQVSSRIDSRTIIDQGGAEALLGNGDMLYLPPGTGIPMRAHGAFVSDSEVHTVVEFLKRTGRANYIEEITRFSEDGGDPSSFKGGSGGGDGEESDALYDEAVRFVTESRKASISSVQRRFKVGYNRAARMIEDMERAGIVGPAETNGSREVLAPPPPEV